LNTGPSTCPRPGPGLLSSDESAPAARHRRGDPSLKRESLNRCAFGSLAMVVLAALLCLTVGAGQIVHAATSSIATIPPPFLPRSAIDQPIPPNPPIHPDSAAMIHDNPNWVLPPNSSYREWLGPRQRTFYAHINPKTPTITLHVNYDDVLGLGCDRHVRTVPMPQSVRGVLFGKVGTYDHDTPTWFVDANGNAWRGFAITAPDVASRDITCPTNQWNALRMDHWGPGSVGNEQTGNGYGAGHSASASGIQSGAGLIRPEQMQLPTGSNLGHALLIDGHLGADVGLRLRVAVIASNSRGSASVILAPSAIVTKGKPSKSQPMAWGGVVDLRRPRRAR
jgi:hypothetical protein